MSQIESFRKQQLLDILMNSMPKPGNIFISLLKFSSYKSPFIVFYMYLMDPLKEVKLNVYICVTESLCCTVDVNTTL